MLADFLTKPLQGGLFRRFRDVLLGYKHTSTLNEQSVTSPEERVGKAICSQKRDENNEGKVIQDSVTYDEIEDAYSIESAEENYENAEESTKSTGDDLWSLVVGKKTTRILHTGNRETKINKDPVYKVHKLCKRSTVNEFNELANIVYLLSSLIERSC
jgi:mRNA deadenylase 3'-5' endonuclease subunit Ccr4